jgi:hypothetical protein
MAAINFYRTTKTETLFVIYTMLLWFIAADAFSSQAEVQHKIALVIGNSNYVSKPLKNPKNDAEDFAAKLTELGFDVIQESDADIEAMETALKSFENRKRPNSVALFYYAGHVVQVDDSNFLIPVGSLTSITKESEVKRHALNVADVITTMQDAENYLNVVILDACRDNPLPASTRSLSRGLKLVSGDQVPPNSVVFYSTGSNKVAQDGDGRNSPFTSSLLRSMNDRTLDIYGVFRETSRRVTKMTNDFQQPEQRLSGAAGEYWFYGKPDGLATGGTADVGEWGKIFDSKDSQVFRNFIKEFPGSRLIDEAKSNIEELVLLDNLSKAPDLTNMDAAFKFSYPVGATVEFDGVPYEIKNQLVIPLQKGDNRFTLVTVKNQMIYGNIEVLYTDSSGIKYQYGSDTQLPKDSHIKRVLQGAPVRYTVTTSSEQGTRVPGMRYTLSVLPF